MITMKRSSSSSKDIGLVFAPETPASWEAGGAVEIGQVPRPLYLTAQEAEVLLSLSVISPLFGGEIENSLFAKLGQYLRGA